MIFKFKIEKAMQAIASMLHFHNTREMSYLRMLKLLYIADRESIKETGLPITGDHVVAMEHGPVLSGVYDLLKGASTSWPLWSQYFQTCGYRIVLVGEPGNGKLSKYEIGKLREIAARYENMNDWDLVEHVHTFDEWKRNNPGKSSKPIPLDHILEAVGRIADRDAILQEVQDEIAFDVLFASVKGNNALSGVEQ